MEQVKAQNDRILRHGFSLTELLVIIAILAVLAGIIFPVFINAKEASRKATCSSNLKQITAAALMYSADNDTYVVPYFSIIEATHDPAKYTVWSWYDKRHYAGSDVTQDLTAGLLSSYFKGKTFGDCLTAGGIPEKPKGVYRYAIAPNREIGAHFRNTESDLPRPSETIHMADCANISSSADITLTRFDSLISNDCEHGLAHGRHNRKANVGWMDGHIKALTVTVGACGAEVEINFFHKRNDLGYIMKFPKDASQTSMSDRDRFYYMLQKPPGT